jgi:uncharacterized protein (TIGR03790 family)
LPRRSYPPLLLSLLACLCACSPDGHPEVAVVVNARSPVSVAIGEHYAVRRGIPARRIVRLSIPVEDPLLRDDRHETISREGFDEWVRGPLERWLLEHGEGVEILVTTKGVPLRVAGAPVPAEDLLRLGTGASVDAELSLLFSPWVGNAGVAGSRNPYYDDPRPFSRFRREEPGAPLRYLVARLTGYADASPSDSVPADVRRLVDAARAPIDPEALWLVDLDPTLPPALDAGNRLLLEPAAAALAASGRPTVRDAAPAFARDVDAIQGYASWGSNDGHEAAARTYGRIGDHLYPGVFAGRAIAVDLVSTNARTFSRGAGYGQSLLADLVAGGVAGAAGHVDEPTLPAVARPHLLLGHYARGSLAIEAYYRALPFLGWTNVYVGDPLMRLDTPASAGAAPDRDGDGVPDDVDVCRDLPDPDQRDTDGDGIGNPCDADVDQDGRVTTSWGESQPRSARGDVEWIALTARAGAYAADHDLDGDGSVDERDVSMAQMALFGPPGPGRPRAAGHARQ